MYNSTDFIITFNTRTFSYSEIALSTQNNGADAVI